MHQNNLGDRSPRSRLTGWQLTLLLGSLTALGPLTIDMYLPAFPLLTDDLNTSMSLTQLSLTSCLLGLATGQVLFGSLSDVYGRRGILMISLILYLVSGLACALAPSIGFFVVSRFIQGVAGAGGMVIARACIRDLYSGSDITKMLSMLMLVMGVAPILAPVIGGQMLYFVSWRGIFYFLFLAGCLLLTSVFIGLPETLAKEHRSRADFGHMAGVFKDLLQNRLFMGYVLSQAFISATMFSYMAGSPFVLQDIYGLSPQMYSLFFGLISMGVILCSQIAGRLAYKVGEERFLQIGIGVSLSSTGLLVILFWSGAGLAFIIPALFIAVSCIGLVSPSASSLALQPHGKRAGSASALLGLIQFSLSGLVVPLVGLGGRDTALPMGVVMMSASLMALFSYLILIRMGKRFVEKESQT